MASTFSLQPVGSRDAPATGQFQSWRCRYDGAAPRSAGVNPPAGVIHASETCDRQKRIEPRSASNTGGASSSARMIVSRTGSTGRGLAYRRRVGRSQLVRSVPGGTARIPGAGGSMHLVAPPLRNTTSHVRLGGGSARAGSATNHIVATASTRTRIKSGTTGLGSPACPLERSLPKTSPLTPGTADLAADTYAPSAVCRLHPCPARQQLLVRTDVRSWPGFSRPRHDRPEAVATSSSGALRRVR